MPVIVRIFHQDREQLVLGQRILDVARPLEVHRPVCWPAGLAVDLQFGSLPPFPLTGGAFQLVV